MTIEAGVGIRRFPGREDHDRPSREWRDRSQSATIPGVTSLWQEMHSWVFSLNGAEAPAAAADRKSMGITKGSIFFIEAPHNHVAK